MRIGYMVGEGSGASPDVAALLERGRRIEQAGLDTAWIAQIGLDAMTAATALGAVTDRIEIGTAVVPSPPRHPHAMAQQAAATQQVCGGRFTLGIGLSHKILVEDSLGLSYSRPAARTREYLECLGPMLRGEAVDFEGEFHRVRTGPIPLGTPTDVLVAALGPAMLRVAGRLSSGTITWASGLTTLESHIVPTIRGAAAEAGRPDPRVVGGFPVVVTDDVAAAGELAGQLFGFYKTLPSYRAMLDREGAGGVEDLVIAGDEAAVRDQVARLESVGVTDLCAFPFGTGAEIDRTIALLGALSG